MITCNLRLDSGLITERASEVCGLGSTGEGIAHLDPLGRFKSGPWLEHRLHTLVAPSFCLAVSRSALRICKGDGVHPRVYWL